MPPAPAVEQQSQPTEQPASTPTASVVHMPKMMATASISQPVETQPVESEVTFVELDDERLKALWSEALAALDNETFSKVAEDCELTLVDQNSFKIVTHNVFFERDYNAVKTDLLSYIRKHSGHAHLNSEVNVLMAKVKKHAYTPSEKYEEMLQQNPQLGVFRKVFSDIDF